MSLAGSDSYSMCARLNSLVQAEPVATLTNATPVEVDLADFREPVRVLMVPGAGDSMLLQALVDAAWVDVYDTAVTFQPIEITLTRGSGTSMATRVRVTLYAGDGPAPVFVTGA